MIDEGGPSAHKSCSCPFASLRRRRPRASHSVIPMKWKVLTSPAVGSVTQGQGFQISNCYPLVARGISWHFAIGCPASFWSKHAQPGSRLSSAAGRHLVVGTPRGGGGWRGGCFRGGRRSLTPTPQVTSQLPPSEGAFVPMPHPWPTSLHNLIDVYIDVHRRAGPNTGHKCSSMRAQVYVHTTPMAGPAPHLR